jgi:predicted dehydrogenase
MLGRQHAGNLAHHIPHTRLVAVADVRAETAEAVARELGAATHYTTAEELAADPDVEAIVIASADEAHIDGILAAAANRKDVFCEKPITTSLEDADRALAAVADANVRLQIGFMRQYDDAYIAAKHAIEAGKIGTPVFFKNAHRGKDPFGPERPASTGCSPMAFVNSNIHDYNDARWLLGDEAVEVTARGTRVVAPTAKEGVDAAVSTVRFSNGALADIEFVSATRYGYDVRTEIVGDLGSLFIGSIQGTACVLATSEGLQQPAMDHWLNRYGNAYLTELTDWSRRMLGGEPPFVTGADGRAALEIALAAQRSMLEGRTIQLPLSQPQDG